MGRKHIEGHQEHKLMVVTWGPIRLKNGSQDVHSLFPVRCDYILFHLCGPCNHICPHKREGNVKIEARRNLKMLLDLNMQDGSRSQRSNNAALVAGKTKTEHLS